MSTKQDEIIKTLGVKSPINVSEEIMNRVNFLKSYLIRYNLNGFVLGISGGVDSTVAGRLAQIAVNELNRMPFGKEFKFVAMRLPYGVQMDEADAKKALEFIEPSEVVTYDIKPQVDAAMQQHLSLGREISDYNKGNHKARARMLAQYDIAASEGLVVIGTDHAAEAVTGFFTKFGDGAADVLPLSGLSKRQVREVAKFLRAPEELFMKAPTADLLDNNPGQTDETELGLSYSDIDDYLEGFVVSDEVTEKIEAQYKKTQHKRELPVTPYEFIEALNKITDVKEVE